MLKPISTGSPVMATGGNSSTTLPRGVWQRTVILSGAKVMRRGFFSRSVMMRDARSMVLMKVLQSTVTRVFFSLGMTLS